MGKKKKEEEEKKKERKPNERGNEIDLADRSTVSH